MSLYNSRWVEEKVLTFGDSSLCLLLEVIDLSTLKVLYNGVVGYVDSNKWIPLDMEIDSYYRENLRRTATRYHYPAR
jgi:hypothetical protein